MQLIQILLIWTNIWINWDVKLLSWSKRCTLITRLQGWWSVVKWKIINSVKSICTAVCVTCQVSVVKIANEMVWREIVLHNGEQHIMVKLWDDHSEVHLHEGQHVLIYNVKTNSYKSVSLNTIDESSVEVRYILITLHMMFIRHVLLLCDATFALDSAWTMVSKT